MINDVSDLVENLAPDAAQAQITQRRIPVPPRPLKTTENTLPPIRKASEFMASPQPRPAELVEGVLFCGSIMILGGGSKTNKTFSLMDLAISVASGSDWWGLKTEKGRVLYMNLEVQQFSFEERFDDILEAKRLVIDQVDNFEAWNLRGHATNLSTLRDEIVTRTKDKGYKLIVIDPIYTLLGDRDENNAGDMTSLMNEINKISLETGAAIAFSHHFSKGNKAGTEAIDRISGSGVFGRYADALVMVTKHEQEDTFTVDTVLRNFKGLPPFCVEFVHPLMERDDNLDPKKLKKAGASGLRFTKNQLLVALGSDELTTGEWEKKTIAFCGMKDRTFGKRKAELVGEKSVVLTEEKKWKAVTPLGFTDTKLVKMKTEAQVQGATGANAPAAATPGA